VILLTTFEGGVEIQRALKAGARGYLLKSSPPDKLVESIRQVQAGKKAIIQQAYPNPYAGKSDTWRAFAQSPVFGRSRGRSVG